MDHGWRRTLLLMAGLIVGGFVMTRVTAVLVASDGGPAVGILQAARPLWALLILTGCLAVTVAVGGFVGRRTNAVVGLFVVGFSFSLLALRSGTIRDLVLGDGSLSMVAVETALWAGLVLITCVAVFRISGPLPSDSGDERPLGLSAAWSRSALLSTLGAAIVIPTVWLMAQGDLKGQAFAAATIGAVLAGLLGRLAAPNSHPLLLFAAACLFAAGGQVIGMLTLGSPLDEQLQAAFRAGTIPALSTPMPIDFAAGSILGVSIGVGWAKSFLHHPQEQTADIA